MPIRLRLHTKYLVAISGLVKERGWQPGDEVKVESTSGNTVEIGNLMGRSVLKQRVAELREEKRLRLIRQPEDIEKRPEKPSKPDSPSPANPKPSTKSL